MSHVTSSRLINEIKEIDYKSLPAIFHNKTKASHLSEAYNAFKTSEVLKVLEGEHNIVPVGYLVASKDGIGKHAAFLRERKDIVAPSKALALGVKSYPEFIIENSNSGTSAFKMYHAEMVNQCANGLIVSHGSEEKFRSLHRGHTIKEIMKSVSQFMKTRAVISERLESWKNTFLPKKAMLKYATESLVAKYGDSDTKKDLIMNLAPSLLNPIRDNDDVSNLWTLYNNCEERLTKGGLITLNKRSARAMKSFNKIELEKRLSALTQKYFLKFKK